MSERRARAPRALLSSRMLLPERRPGADGSRHRLSACGGSVWILLTVGGELPGGTEVPSDQPPRLRVPHGRPSSPSVTSAPAASASTRYHRLPNRSFSRAPARTGHSGLHPTGHSDGRTIAPLLLAEAVGKTGTRRARAERWDRKRLLDCLLRAPSHQNRRPVSWSGWWCPTGHRYTGRLSGVSDASAQGDSATRTATGSWSSAIAAVAARGLCPSSGVVAARRLAPVRGDPVAQGVPLSTGGDGADDDQGNRGALV